MDSTIWVPLQSDSVFNGVNSNIFFVINLTDYKVCGTVTEK